MCRQERKVTDRHDVVFRAIQRWEEEDRRRREMDRNDDRWLVRLFALCMLVAICWAMSKGWVW